MDNRFEGKGVLVTGGAAADGPRDRLCVRR